MSRRLVVGAWTACLAALSWSSCTSGPTPPKMGSPGWYYAAAREQYAAGDYVKAQEHLEKIMGGEGQYKQRAFTWHMVILAGMARGYRELADAYEAGAPEARAATGEFRRSVNDYRRTSRQYSMGLAEELTRLEKDLAAAEKITLEFPFPSGSGNEPVGWATVRKGILPRDAERSTVLRQSVARGMLLQSAEVVGEDPAKAAETFKTQPVEVPRAIFLHGMGASLVEQAALFDRKKLQEPNNQRLLLGLAATCAKDASEAPSDDALKKRIKDLQAKIEKAQKNVGKL